MMDELFAVILAAILALVFGVLVGHSGGKGYIAADCERLGAFYVGDKVFECKVKVK